MPARIIILEGPDGAGKTTLAHELVKHYNADYVHEGPPPGYLDNLFSYYADILISKVNSEKYTVMDRFWLGELIYGPVARNSCKLEEIDFNTLLNATKRFNCAHIVCLPPLYVCRMVYEEKLKDPHDYLKNREKLELVWNGYYDMLKRYPEYFIAFDFTKMNTNDIIEKIERSVVWA